MTPEIRERLWPYLGGIAKQNGLRAKCFGGVADHVHLLLSLPTTIAVAKAIQLIKSGSSAWIHQTFSQLRNFSWQQGLRGIQRWHVSIAANDSLHRATARTPSDANISGGVYEHFEKARDAIRREIPVGLAGLITPYPTGPIGLGPLPGIPCLATFIQSLRDKIRHAPVVRVRARP